MNAGPDARCELSCGWGDIEKQCSCKPTCGYCAGHHQTSDHRGNLVGCTAQLGSISGHRIEKCPNCKGNHIAFSTGCGKKTEAARAVWQCSKSGLVGHAEIWELTGAHRVTLGMRQRRAEGHDEQEPIVDKEGDDTRANQGAKEAGEVIMAETAGKIEIEMGVPASNAESSPTLWLQVLCVDHSGVGHGTGAKSRFGIIAGAARGMGRNWNQPFSIQH